MCRHAYVVKCFEYYDANRGSRVRKEVDACLFCGREERPRVYVMQDPHTRLERYRPRRR